MDLATAPFLYFFFPLIFVIYMLLPGLRSKNVLLIVGGLCFYTMGQWRALPVLFLSTLAAWGLGWLTGRVRGRRFWLVTALIFQIGVLAIYKYSSTLAALADRVFGWQWPCWEGAIPLGISFFTFKSMAYVIDVYRGDICPGGLGAVLSYLSFFPQITAGPLMRYGSFVLQLQQRTVTPDAIACGLRRFTVGLAKKLLLAAQIGAIADSAFSLGADLDARMAWLGAVAYMLQIYFDFSGYSDMAIGMAAAFGFDTEENFCWPYAAGTITDFWRRWHISLSSWLRDYLYIPLGGNRRGKARQCINKFIVFLVCGLWHGAGGTYLLWGAWHGLLSVLETANRAGLERLRQKRPGRVFFRCCTLLAVCLGFVVFRAATVGEALRFLQTMVAGFSPTPDSALAVARISPAAWCAMGVGTAACLPVKPWLARRFPQTGRVGTVCACIGSGALLLLCMMAMAGGGFKPFIYAQF